MAQMDPSLPPNDPTPVKATRSLPIGTSLSFQHYLLTFSGNFQDNANLHSYKNASNSLSSSPTIQKKVNKKKISSPRKSTIGTIISIIAANKGSFHDLRSFTLWGFTALIIVVRCSSASLIKDLVFHSRSLKLEFHYQLMTMSQLESQNERSPRISPRSNSASPQTPGTLGISSLPNPLVSSPQPSPKTISSENKNPRMVLLPYEEKSSRIPHVLTYMSDPNETQLDVSALGEISQVFADEQVNVQSIHSIRKSDNLSSSLSNPVYDFRVRLESKDQYHILREKVKQISSKFKINIAFQPDSFIRTRRRIVVFDFSGTLVQGNVLSQLAHSLGLEKQFQDIDSKYPPNDMFSKNLGAKAQLLKGKKSDIIRDTAVKIPYTKQAKSIMKLLKAQGYKLAVISSGISLGSAQTDLDLDYCYCNTLLSNNGILTGKVKQPVIDANRKMDLMHFIVQKENIHLSQVVSVGDSLMSSKMLDFAGLGIAFDSLSPAAQDVSNSEIKDLNTVLYLLGLEPEDSLSPPKRIKPTETQILSIITISGEDSFGILSFVFNILLQHPSTFVRGIRQDVVRGRLFLMLVLQYPEKSNNKVIKDLLFEVKNHPDYELDIQFSIHSKITPSDIIPHSPSLISMESKSSVKNPSLLARHQINPTQYVITVIHPQMPFAFLARFISTLEKYGAKVKHIKRLSEERLIGSKPGSADSNSNDNSLQQANHDFTNRHVDHPQLDCLEFTVGLRLETSTFVTLKKNLTLCAAEFNVDMAIQLHANLLKPKRLVVFDCDSTLTKSEMIVEMAKYAGVMDQVQEITLKAMNSNMNFEHSLRKRVSLLKGLELKPLVESLNKELQYTDGAKFLVTTLKSLGLKCVVISGGFMCLLEKIKQELGLDYGFANMLQVHKGYLTGKVVGPLVDGQKKADLLSLIAEDEGIPLDQTIAIGDGSNDLAMLGRAGLGIAFHAKPYVQERAQFKLNFPSLGSLIYLLGIPEFEVRYHWYQQQTD